MPEVLGTEDEVARPRVDWPALALDVPVDLALQHHPPLVVMVVVRVVWLPGRVADQEGLAVVGEHQRLRPRRLALLGDQVRQTALQRAQLEQRDACGHVVAPGRRVIRRRAPFPTWIRAWTSPPGKISTMAMKSTPKIKRWKSTQRTVRYSFKNT